MDEGELSDRRLGWSTSKRGTVGIAGRAIATVQVRRYPIRPCRADLSRAIAPDKPRSDIRRAVGIAIELDVRFLTGRSS